MAWIEVHENLREHSKVYALADTLKIKEYAAVGILVNFWLWALSQTKDGDISNFPPKAIAHAAKWDGKARVLFDALVSCGCIDETETGYCIHDWYDYAGRIIEKRMSNAERMRALRAERATHVQRTCNAQNAHSLRTCEKSAGATVPNRTVPYLDGTNIQEVTACSNVLNGPEMGMQAGTRETQLINSLRIMKGRELSSIELTNIGDHITALGWDALDYAILTVREAKPSAPLKYVFAILGAMRNAGVCDAETLNDYMRRYNERRAKAQQKTGNVFLDLMLGEGGNDGKDGRGADARNDQNLLPGIR